MSDVPGGGGGREGFLKINKSIGKGSQVWLYDMVAHSFKITNENLEMVGERKQMSISLTSNFESKFT